MRLSPIVAGDVGALWAYRANPEVCKYQAFEPATRAEVEAFVRALATTPFAVPGTWFQLAIRRRESGLLIGDLGLHFLAADARQVEIGFTVTPGQQGRGFGSEAVALLLDYLFGPLQMHRVVASTDPRNAASIALLRRVGLRQEAHFRQSLWFKGAWADDLVFAILASEWTGR